MEKTVDRRADFGGPIHRGVGIAAEIDPSDGKDEHRDQEANIAQNPKDPLLSALLSVHLRAAG